jgi:hypothetical protein
MIRVDATEAELAYSALRIQTKRLQGYTTSRIAQCDQGMGADKLLEICHVYRDILTAFAAHEAVTGIRAFARVVESDNTYDVVVVHNATKTAMVAVMDHIRTLLPRGAGNYLMIFTLDTDFGRTYRQFSAAELLTLKSLLQAVIA